MTAAMQSISMIPLTPSEALFADWEPQRARWEELEKRSLPDGTALARWIADWSELSDAVYEVGARLSIARTCDTVDAAKSAAYLHFIETVEPQLAVVTDKLNRKLVAHPDCARLSPEHGPWLYSVRTGIELFRDENIPLHTELSRLVTQYDEIQGAMTVEWEGKALNMAQMEALQQSPDRCLRERAWRLVAARRLQDRDRLNALYDEMLGLRRKIAANLGLPDFTAYTFKNKLRTDYSAADCLAYHDAAAEVAVPLFRESLTARAKALGLERLRPWDLGCDPNGQPPLRPFEEVDALAEKTGRIFARLDPELGGLYGMLREKSLMDLDSRIGKAPGGYAYPLNKSRLPFIFMNAVGMHKDVLTLLHESGHAFHFLLGGGHALPFNRLAPMEFCEVASMAMEQLGAPQLTEFYSEADCLRARRDKAADILRSFCWIATIDAFQHWIYSAPHSVAQRNAKWLELEERFGPGVDWSGLEEFHDHSWQKQLHLYHEPFYYIEYGIAQIGALQVWLRSLENPVEALRLYKAALALGGTLGLKDLFTAAGLHFGMNAATLRPLLEEVHKEWRATAG